MFFDERLAYTKHTHQLKTGLKNNKGNDAHQNLIEEQMWRL